MVTHSGYFSRSPNHPIYTLTEWLLNQVTQPGRIHWLKQTVDQVTQSATWPDSLHHLPMVTHQPDDINVHLTNQVNQN